MVERSRRITRALARTAAVLLILAAPFSWIAGYHRRALYLVVLSIIVYLVLGRRHGPPSERA